MPRVLHRITPNRLRELREQVSRIVEQRLAGRVICSRCGATIKTFSDVCTADLLDRCPGFEAIDRVQVVVEREVGLA